MVSRHYISALNILFKAQTKCNLVTRTYVVGLGSVTRVLVGFDIYIPVEVEWCGGVACVRSLLRALCSGCLNE